MSTLKCKKCSKDFENVYYDTDNKRHNLCNREYCLECSPFGLHNTKKIEILGNPESKICILCNQNKPSDQFYNKKRDNKLFSYCKDCVSKLTIERQKRNKQKSIDYKGGCCQICGYKKCNDALQFHHLDASKKEFTLGQNHLKSFENIVKELDKCVLLCSRCHTEVHAGLHKEKIDVLTVNK